MKLWGGRFEAETDQLVEEYTASIGFDQRLYKYDIEGSIAHVKMLAHSEILTLDERDKIISGLEEILEEIENDEFEFEIGLEDIHMNIEKKLIDKIGSVGGKLHTARSRNDQVALDMRLYLKDQINDIKALIQKLQKVLLESAEENIDIIMPGYTHLQRAQPVRVSHHLLAYYAKLKRDYDRLIDCYKRTNVLPLGAGALAGTTFNIDREFVADELGFNKVSQNSLDTVSDRDFVIEFLAAASTLMMHLSRFSEELVLWTSQEFDFINIDDAFCTGSSIMPQKKNPDVPELIRGKTGRVYGHLMQILTVMKGLPLAYNKDMQEDKEGLFDTVSTLKGAIELFARMLAKTTFKQQKLEETAEDGFTNATEVADYLVEKGVPFREAHEVVGKTVLHCVKEEKKLSDLKLKEWKEFSNKFEDDIYKKIDIKTAVDTRNIIGGPAKKEVLRVIKTEKEELKKD
ncbi:argininosuccinate lyase [Selenihalanaerobacter shriftii]|uniref:Argininosuccinate lyase n=1 Tax=Selenihalanaerobacter shriftii TaxID=142842 RepID=A0A1T4JMG9_9FIRM|nr:argininosuccinate lyase [Selenihalanaerobacter shriftii]SJZ31353.1 argininosuccinate lyase [Selenihalanaerobacter shriftii]